MTLPQTDRFFKLVHAGTLLEYHSDKMEAKRRRAEILEDKPEMGHIDLMRGPDHWKGETE